MNGVVDDWRAAMLEPDGILKQDGTCLALSVSLSGMPPDAVLEIALPGDYARLSLGQLLDAVFPEDEADQLAVEGMLDVAENPDLPDIYDCFLPVIDQYRSGLCYLKLTAGAGRAVELSDIAADLLQPAPADSPTGSVDNPAHLGLELTIEPEYLPLDYAIAQGYADSEEELLAWLQSCTLLYFLDKHEYRLPPLAEISESSPLQSIAAGLFDRGFLASGCETGPPQITPEGRRFIGALLAETEGYIDRFDVFKDALWDEDTDSAEFDTGYGEDLRVQVFITEGLDPVRTVFLLRLYDGTLDEFVATWPQFIGDSTFFNQILEPLVNRSQLPEELLREIVEEGYAYLEEQAEAVREERSQSQIARRLRASFSGPETDEPPTA